MASKETMGSAGVKGVTPSSLLNWGQERSDAAVALQNAVMESYEQMSRTWLDRMQSELSLWSDMANKLSGTKTIPEALEVCTKCASQRMQMANDDSRRVVDEAQRITQKIAKALGNGWPAAST